MSSSMTDMGTSRSAITIAQVDGKLKAVQITKQGEAFEVLWAKSSKGGDADWPRFASECGLSVGPAEQTKADDDKTVVVGFGSAGVAFYHLDLPKTKEEELAAMVRLQAETLLPLPVEKMEITWRTKPAPGGKVAITMVAARREYLQQFVENVRVFKPTEILLDCEAIIKVWKGLFYRKETPHLPVENRYHTRKCVVVSLSARSTQVCLAEDGRLSNAVVLDMGTEDFLETANDLLDSAHKAEPEQTETTERFVQDIRSALESFGHAELTKLPIFILSDGSKAIEGIASCLKSAGLDARAALPEIEKIGAQRQFKAEQLYEYRVPIGLALMALQRPVEDLNLFENLYRPAGKEQKSPLLYSPKIAGTIAAAMLALFVIVSYAVDVFSPNAIQKHLTTADSSTNIDLLMQRQKLIKAVALERPNLLELLNQVTESGDNGIKLGSFHFKKGQLVSISGQAQNPDQLYKFQEALLSKKGIKEVKIQSASTDSKSKKLKFTINFHYKNFTKKGTRA